MMIGRSPGLTPLKPLRRLASRRPENPPAAAIYRTESVPTVRYSSVMSKKTDSAATVDKNGKLSNTVFHEQMTEGVDDHEFRMKTRAKLLAAGVAVAVLDSVLPEKP
jgi:hypothetical protein